MAQSALLHIKRGFYQAGYVWGRALDANPTLPSPSEWGWKLDSEKIWAPYGVPCQEHQKAAENSLRIHVKNGAQEDASVLNQTSHAHSCVFVVDNVQFWTS